MALSPMLLGQYKALLFSPAGTQTAEFDNWRSIELRHLVNDVGYATLTISGLDARVDLFEDNSILEVWRRVPGLAPTAIPANRLREDNWYCEWEGLHGDFEHTTFQNGDTVFVSRCDGYLDFARRREILYYATIAASASKKVALPAQTAMYEFVRENCGSAATLANGRLFEGVFTGLNVPAMIGGGAVWNGARAYRNVLEILQELGIYAGIDFDIIGLGGANWSFETYINQLGQDRTVAGLDPATGLNAAGNPPVVFSMTNENMSQVTLKSTRRSSANVVAALGKGEYTARDVMFAVDSGEIDAARINQREITRNANTQDSSAELQAVADGVLEEKRYTEDLTFVPMVTRSSMYGVHYWWTDRITAEHRGVERDKRLTGITIKVDENGEQFSQWEFDTIPRTR